MTGDRPFGLEVDGGFNADTAHLAGAAGGNSMAVMTCPPATLVSVPDARPNPGGRPPPEKRWESCSSLI